MGSSVLCICAWLSVRPTASIGVSQPVLIRWQTDGQDAPHRRKAIQQHLPLGYGYPRDGSDPIR